MDMIPRAPLIVLAVLGVTLIIIQLIGLIFNPSQGIVSGVEISPPSPVQGDLITITVIATPNRSVPVEVFYSTTLTVTNGRYEILLEGLRVPNPPNSFEVNASVVTDLNVAVHAGIWMTKNVKGIRGMATVSQEGVPAGGYEVRIFGNASPGVSEVDISLVASSSVVVGPDGSYSYSYDMLIVPPGNLKVVAGGVTRSVSILP